LKRENTDASLRERGLALAEAGKFDQALAVMKEHLARDPEDGQALNDAGAILFALRRYDEAVEYLSRALGRLGRQRGQALWNLCEVHLAAGRPDRALAIFDDMAAEGMMTPDLANRTATKFLDKQDTDGAIEALIRSLKICPEQEALVPAAEVIRAKRAKIAFFCENRDTKFLTDIFGFVNARFPARLCTTWGGQESRRLLEWCDIAWFEWCTKQVVEASQMPKTCKMIVRLHRYEAYRPWPEQVRWENVDALVTIGNSAVMAHLRQRIAGLDDRTEVVPIPNGVDLERFSFRQRTRGKNLAVVANINYWKNSMFLLQCFAKLRTVDPEYKLYFAGPFQDDGVLQRYLHYMMEELDCADSVFFEGWQEDIPGWLEDKHYVLSGSIVEGHPVNILEGMACGLKPVVHTFPGCRDFFPPELLFRTVDEFCDRILNEPYEPQTYRDFVAERYSKDAQLQSVKKLLCRMEKALAKPGQYAPSADLPERDEACSGPGAAGAAVADGRRGTYWQKVLGAVSIVGTNGLKILDLGCGRGELDSYLAEFGDVTGIDDDRRDIAAARENCTSGTFICADFLTVYLPEDCFDAVVDQRAFRRLSRDEQERHLGRAYEAMKPGGVLLLTLPQASPADESSRDADEPAEGASSVEAAGALVSQAGFELVRVDSVAGGAGPAGAALILTARKPKT